MTTPSTEAGRALSPLEGYILDRGYVINPSNDDRERITVQHLQDGQGWILDVIDLACVMVHMRREAAAAARCAHEWTDVDVPEVQGDAEVCRLCGIERDSDELIERQAAAAARADADRLAEALAAMHGSYHASFRCGPQCFAFAALAAHEAKLTGPNRS